MKDNKRSVDNLDIKAFVKKVFQESSWLMAKLAASPEDEGECFVDMGRSISIKRLNVQIYSRDDLFKFLKKNQFTDDDALIICRETRLSGEGHLSALSEEKLKEASVNENSVEFMRSIHCIFVKAHGIANLKMLLKLAKTYLEEPKMFYEAYLPMNKQTLSKINETGDLIS